MSAVFKKPKPQTIVMPEPYVPETVDQAEKVREFERKRKKRMGAVSQILSAHNENPKKTLGV